MRTLVVTAHTLPILAKDHTVVNAVEACGLSKKKKIQPRPPPILVLGACRLDTGSQNAPASLTHR